MESKLGPEKFNHTTIHQVALAQAGWKLGKLLQGVDVDRVDVLGRAALHYAAANQSDATKYLLHVGANTRLRDIIHWTPLHYASWCGNVKAARILIHRGAEVDAIGRDGITPLHCAVARDHVDIAVMLLGAGANVELQDNRRRTPLHWASYSGSVAIADLLLKKGAYRQCRDEYGRTPL
ncbi:ankyrin repeat-containing domain protein, partial [Kalaharituber pfeilii]